MCSSIGLFTTFLALQATRWLKSNINSFSVTREFSYSVQGHNYLSACIITQIIFIKTHIMCNYHAGHMWPCLKWVSPATSQIASIELYNSQQFPEAHMSVMFHKQWYMWPYLEWATHATASTIYQATTSFLVIYLISIPLLVGLNRFTYNFLQGCCTYLLSREKWTRLICAWENIIMYQLFP